MPPTPSAHRHAFLLLALVVVFVLRPGATAAPKPWLKLEADDFTIYSDASEKQILRCALDYAAYRRAFADLFVSPDRTLPRSVLLLFRNDAAFHDYVPDRTERGSNARLSNYSFTVDGSPVSAFSLESGRSRALELTFEFETVWALERLGYAVPIWMSQGAGEVLSSVTYGKGVCIVGGSAGRNARTDLAWPEFFAVGTLSDSYNDPRNLSDFLAQSWGLMHWILLSDAQARERFTALAARLAHSSAADAVAETMQTPLARFDRAIQASLRSGARRKIPFDDAAVRASFHLVPAPPAEVLIQKSNICVALDDVSRGDEQLDLARGLAPDLPMAQEAWARRMQREGQRNDALLAYRAAIAAGSKNVTAYLTSAAARLDDNRSRGFDEAGEGGTQGTLALAELRQAIALDPFNPAAYAQLGRAFYVQKEVTPADLDELSVGLVPGPAGVPVRYYRAMLSVRLHRSDDAIADLDFLAASPDSDERLREIARDRAAIERVNRDVVVGESFLKAHNYAALRVLASAGLSGPSISDDARTRYAHLLALAAEEEAWDKVKALDDGAHAAALDKAVRDFLQGYPDSRHRNDAYELLMRTAFPDRKPPPPPVR
ncbi:tetratricopeptide repeat protein [Horticoccus luteus]|uniref:Tetratricopeptide repeat protein n=1 Tax=Horticoccus luteus TaxID=2862869 RepID=A0A8F9XGT7_9BACT|nr:tetratricopeptide repeat protein [Horticoccus luteus]QYM78595.1 tetratricopeptide repeat protein [Horticoccus luteus]